VRRWHFRLGGLHGLTVLGRLLLVRFLLGRLLHRIPGQATLGLLQLQLRVRHRLLRHRHENGCFLPRTMEQLQGGIRTSLDRTLKKRAVDTRHAAGVVIRLACIAYEITSLPLKKHGFLDFCQINRTYAEETVEKNGELLFAGTTASGYVVGAAL
jgi:hypothetical protein